MRAPRLRSSKVRLAVLQCLQTMAKSDSKALHTHWTSLMPVQHPLTPRPLQPTLVTMLLFDPVPKVRAHLEGRRMQRIGYKGV